MTVWDAREPVASEARTWRQWISVPPKVPLEGTEGGSPSGRDPDTHVALASRQQAPLTHEPLLVFLTWTPNAPGREAGEARGAAGKGPDVASDGEAGSENTASP